MTTKTDYDWEQMEREYEGYVPYLTPHELAALNQECEGCGRPDARLLCDDCHMRQMNDEADALLTERERLGER